MGDNINVEVGGLERGGDSNQTATGWCQSYLLLYHDSN